MEGPQSAPKLKTQTTQADFPDGYTSVFLARNPSLSSNTKSQGTQVSFCLNNSSRLNEMSIVFAGNNNLASHMFLSAETLQNIFSIH